MCSLSTWYLFEDFCKSVPFIGLPILNSIKKFRCLVFLGVFILCYPYLEMTFKVIHFLLVKPFFIHCNWVYDRISSSATMIKETVNPSESILNILLDSSRDLMDKLILTKKLLERRLIRVMEVARFGAIFKVVKCSFVLLALSIIFGLIYYFSSRIYSLVYGIFTSLISLLRSLYGL
uniref:Uncharacterized protein n=2 Tax=Glomeraceae TaxID=36751 RepID=X5GFC5_9GLOM|nr:hypothetical protein [Glomus sp. DAOM 229456]AHX00139.1 hypothetical protein [Rhizophagus irregularis]